MPIFGSGSGEPRPRGSLLPFQDTIRSTLGLVLLNTPRVS